MKSYHCRSLMFALLLCVCPCLPTLAGEKPELRVAIGPFFSPVGQEKLQQASSVLPELLMTELSRVPRFQLVERQKVQSICNELNLGASGLVARDTVAKMGHVLACDWLVTGSLVQNGRRTVVWTKIIDVRNGVIFDLNTTPYDEANVTKTVAEISDFIGQAGGQRKAKQFLALGPFVDMNPRLSPTREDWSTRLPAAIEKHFHEAGFGISEIGAVMPLFEERRLEKAGLTAQPEKRVKLQAAFWLIDGGCEWVTNKPGELRVGLRVQRVGGPEQMFWITAAAGEAVEQQLLQTIDRALAKVPDGSPEAAAKAEADLLASRGAEQATRNSPFRVKYTGAKRLDGIAQLQQAEEQQKRLMANRAATIATYQRNLLLDPKNLETKTMLGYALLMDPDSAQRERGKELLREVVAAGDPKYTARAQRHLTHADSHAAEAIKQTIRPVPSTDRDALEKAVAADPSDLNSKYELGALLMFASKGADRGRGASLLGEVMDKGSSDLAEKARQHMPEWAMAQRARKKAAEAAASPASSTPGRP